MLAAETLLLLTVLVPLAAVIGIVALGHSPNLREGVSLTASVVLIYLTVGLSMICQCMSYFVSHNSCNSGFPISNW